jgi:hypothetical protein
LDQECYLITSDSKANVIISSNGIYPIAKINLEMLLKEYIDQNAQPSAPITTLKKV